MFSFLLRVLAVSTVALHYANAEAAIGRTLKAAALHSDIARRSYEVPVRQRLRLDYVEDESSEADHIAAQVELEGNSHSLLLEELDHMLEEVYCGGGRLDVTFSSQYFSHARQKIETYSDLLIITSHYGCNDAGSRLPYKVIDRTYSDVGCTAQFSLGPASWKKDYKLEVKFGSDDKSRYHINRHDHLRRRSIANRDVLDSVESAVPLFGTAVVSETATVAGSDRVTFPTATETARVNRTTVSEDVASSFKDTQIFPSESEGIKVTTPGLSKSGVIITCKECSTSGKIRLTSGSFSSDSNPGASDFISSGFVSVVADELAATMAFDTTWTPSATKSINLTLPQIPLSPIAIPEVANIGITFTPHIMLSATISSTLAFSYGFNASVPSNSTAVANFGSPTNSTAKGFDQASITPLSFNAGIPSIGAVELSATLQPEITLGVVVLDQTLGAALFINMPQLSATIEGVNGTTSTCDPADAPANGTSAADAQNEANQVADLLGPLVNVKPAVELAAGFVLEAGDAVQVAWTPLATQFPIPTGCFAFEKDKKGFVPAAAAYASATSSKEAQASRTGAAAAASSSADSGAGALGSEIGIEGGGVRWRVTVVALGVVFGGFLVM